MRIVGLALALLVPVVFGQGVVASPGESVSSYVQADPAVSTAELAVDLTTGITLHENNADAQLPPASTSKLVTALTALRILPLNEQVTIVESDMVAEEFSRMGLEPGDVASVEQLLYGALIPSGADAAQALARAGGTHLDPQAPDPIERFVQEMNVEAARIGMANSSFGNPVGQDDERSWTTARDLARAGKAILEDPLLSTIVRTPWASTVVTGPNEREIVIENTNQFVLFDDAIGIKTGTTDAAGQNLISAFRFGDHIVVTVVLGSVDRYTETSAMLDSIRQTWTWLQLGRDAGSMGANEELAAKGLWMPVGRTILVRVDQLPLMTYSINLDGDTPGSARGHVTFKVDGAVMAELPIYPVGQPGSE